MDRVQCPHCGKEHDLSDSEIAFGLPDDVHILSADARKQRAQWDSDLCCLDGRRYFIRGMLDLPVRGRTVPFGWGLWVEVERKAFDRYVALWDSPDQGEEPPFHGSIANTLAPYPQTIGLPVQVQLTTPKQRPAFHSLDGDHALTVDQRNGIELTRVLEFLAPHIHGAENQ